MAASLERVEQLRRDMVSDVAHELRTPLTNIRGYLEALQDGVVPPTQETFQLLQEETLRLISLVENLLQLARADAARLSLDLEQTDIVELASRALKKFDLEFKQKDIQVRTELGEAGTPVLADREKISRVIENLLKNALQYTPESGSVLVRTESSGQALKFFVENSGPGIEAKDLPFIFERFYRAREIPFQRLWRHGNRARHSKGDPGSPRGKNRGGKRSRQNSVLVQPACRGPRSNSLPLVR